MHLDLACSGERHGLGQKEQIQEHMYNELLGLRYQIHPLYHLRRP